MDLVEFADRVRPLLENLRRVAAGTVGDVDVVGRDCGSHAV